MFYLKIFLSLKTEGDIKLMMTHRDIECLWAGHKPEVCERAVWRIDLISIFILRQVRCQGTRKQDQVEFSGSSLDRLHTILYGLGLTGVFYRK